MLLNKTALAREALQAGPAGGLSVLDRRILIVTDGRRTLNDVMALLGSEILPAIDRLIRDGYISNGAVATPAAAPVSVPAAPGLGGAFTGLLRAATDAVQARTEHLRASAAHATPATPGVVVQAPPARASASIVPSPAPANRGARRSLVAAKLYVVDMLQLQRHPDAIEHRTTIQCATTPEAVLAAIFGGVRVLVQLTNERYGQRILAHLGDVLPDTELPQLAALAAELQAHNAADPVGIPQLRVVNT